MATEKQITERWGATHEISKQRLVGEIDLSYLNKNESVAMGDGKTFYWLLTEKEVVKNNLVQADVIKSVCEHKGRWLPDPLGGKFCVECGCFVDKEQTVL